MLSLGTVLYLHKYNKEVIDSFLSNSSYASYNQVTLHWKFPNSIVCQCSVGSNEIGNTVNDCFPLLSMV